VICPRCGAALEPDEAGACRACARPERPPERGVDELWSGPLAPQTRRLLRNLGLFLAVGVAALFWELLFRRTAG
jgi:predicted amidophosphoribosyltransferase